MRGKFSKRSADLEYRKKISEANRHRWSVEENRKRQSKIAKVQWSDDEHRKTMKKKTRKQWKDRGFLSDVGAFDIYSDQLSFAEDVRRDTDRYEALQVKCAYCGQWYTPLKKNVINRALYLRGGGTYESRFYCSEHCKTACPIFNQKFFPKDFKPATSREVQPELRQMVLERDGYTCQKCGALIEEKQLHCHHIYPVAIEPLESVDVDNCTTLCIDCHHEAHRLPGCSSAELAACA